MLLALGALGALASPALAQPSPAPPTVIDGPSGAILGLGGLSVARDGTGGLVYTKAVAGIPHVFASALLGGTLQPPQEVDSGLAGASSQPVIAAGNGGVLLIGFINGGQLYVVDRASATAAYGAPDALAGGAINPALEMTNFGKGYLAFTVADGAGHDVRTAYYDNGAWSLESSPLNAVPADDAGTGTGAPQVAAAGDGVAIVAWGEGGHVVTRKVWGTAPSIVDEQADPSSISGCPEVSAGQPEVASGGDSSYADVAFEETVSCGGVEQTRVMVNRLHASQYDGATAGDGLSTPGTESGTEPEVAMTEYGQGFVTSAGGTSNDVFAMELGNNGGYGPILQVNSLPATGPPYAVPGVAGLFSTFVAWQQTPGTSGPSEIRLRYEPRASTLGPELVVSSPRQGATDAARGLAAAGDISGDVAIAWVQGTGASTEIVADELYQPPGAARRPEGARLFPDGQPRVPLEAVERPVGADHLHRQRRRGGGRADRGRLAPGAVGARRRRPRLAGDRVEPGGPDRHLEDRQGVRRHGGAAAEGHRVRPATGRLRGGAPAVLPRPRARLRRSEVDDPVGRRDGHARQARHAPDRPRLWPAGPVQDRGHGRRPCRQPEDGGSHRQDQRAGG